MHFFLFLLRWEELEDYQTKTGQPAISMLVENFPEAAEVALNQCVHHSPHLNISDPDYTVTYDFKCLDPGPQVKDCRERFSVVETMIKHKRERLLLHPLTLKFSERKWTTLGRFGFLGDFFTYFTLSILLSVFVVQQRPAYLHGIQLTTNSSEERSVHINIQIVDEGDAAFTKSVPLIVMVFTMLHICKEFFQIYMARWKYFKDTSNYLDWILYISTSLFMAPYLVSPGSFSTVFWPFGVVAVFVCYTNMLLFLRRYRLFGTYISMYIEVTKTVVQVMVVFIFLVMGFALAFYILFKEQVRDRYHTYVAVVIGLRKLLVQRPND